MPVGAALGRSHDGCVGVALGRAIAGIDEMVVRIAGERMYLWRAVDHEGEVLDMLVQSRRDTRAALRLMRKLLKKQGVAPKLLGHRQAALLRRGVPASATDLPA
jgi:transposase-like protein